MNTNKTALSAALWLITGIAALSTPSYAADSPPKKPAASQAPAKPEAPGWMCDHEYGAMGGPGMMGMGDPGMMGMGGPGMMDEGRPERMGRYGPGMMMDSPRMGLVMSLDLDDDQRSRINKLSDELRHNNWATKGLIMDESAKLRDLYAADRRDPAAIGKQYQRIFDLQRQMIEATVTAQNRIEELLTPDQRAQLKKMHRRKMPMHDYPIR